MSDAAAKFPADFYALGDAIFVLLLMVYGLIEQVEGADASIPSYGMGNPPVAVVEVGGHSYRITIRDEARSYIGDES